MIPALMILLASEALAGRTTEVAVVGLHVRGLSDDEAVAAADALVAAIDDTGRLEAVPPGEVRARIAGREQLILEDLFLSEGRRHLDEGRILYERADFEAAAESLSRAVDELESGQLGTTAPRDLVEALLLLGQTHLSLGDQDAARADYARVVVLDPTRRLDPVNYPPKIVRFYDAVREQTLGRARASLVVRAPEGTRVYVDGHEILGEQALSLPPGAHYALAVGEDGRRDFARLDLQPGSRHTWEPQLDARVLARPSGTPEGRSDQVERLYRSLGEHAGTPLVVLGGEVGADRVALQLYEPATGNFSKYVTAPADADPVGAALDLVPTLARYVTDEGTLRTDRVGVEVAPLYISDNPLISSILLDPQPIVETVTVTRGPPWYLWAGVGVAAAGGAAGAVWAVLASQQPEPAGDQGTITVGPFP